jgi:hypothetical protein
MGDSELRRVMRVLMGAIDEVREAYGKEAENASGGDVLERVGQRLWEVQGSLLTESPERYVEEVRQVSAGLRRDAKSLSRLGQRHLADTVLDAADALEAWTQITRIAVEAGLAG